MVVLLSAEDLGGKGSEEDLAVSDDQDLDSEVSEGHGSEEDLGVVVSVLLVGKQELVSESNYKMCPSFIKYIISIVKYLGKHQ